VVATVDGEFTLKHLARDESGFFLRPANPPYAPIRPNGGVSGLRGGGGAYPQVYAACERARHHRSGYYPDLGKSVLDFI
jgi:hypothetical protein